VLDVLGRFLNMGVEAYNFVSALNCILAQRLVRVICDHCKHPVTYPEALLIESGLDPDEWRHIPMMEGTGVFRMRRDRLPRPLGYPRTARFDGPDSRADSRQAAHHGNQGAPPRKTA